MGENLLISQCSVHPRVSSSATASPVAGARAMPSPPWPVHWQKPGTDSTRPMYGSPSGVPGRTPA